MGNALETQGGSAYYSSFLKGTTDLLTTIIPFFMKKVWWPAERMAAVSDRFPGLFSGKM